MAEDSKIESNFHREGMAYVRCPSCSKLYEVDPDLIYVERPEFDCTNCSAEFWISLDQALDASEVVGTLIEPHEKVQPSFAAEEDLSLREGISEIEDHEGNQEHEQQVLLSAEDVKPDYDEGISSAEEIFEEKAHQETVEAMEEVRLESEHVEISLSELWSSLLMDFESQDMHDEFVLACKDRDSLDFAIERYSKVLEQDPLNKIARQRLDGFRLSALSRLESETSSNALIRAVEYWPALPVTLGMSLITLGLLDSGLRNLVGLGVALIFFTFALQALFQKPD